MIDELDLDERAWDAGALSGVLALAASQPGVRLARDVARAGIEMRKAGLAPVVAGSLRRLADYAESDRSSIRRAIADDGTVVLLFSDIEGSTALNERLGDTAWLELLGEHNALVRGQVRRHHGRVVKTQGDSFMVVFRELSDALHCAVAIQHELRDRDDADPGLRVRIGIHRGEVTRRGRDVFGLNVALAARVAAEARGGEILVSAAAREQARDSTEVAFGRSRSAHLRGISKPVRVYPVRL